MASKGLNTGVIDPSKGIVKSESELKEEVLRLKRQMAEIYQAWINGCPPPLFPDAQHYAPKPIFKVSGPYSHDPHFETPGETTKLAKTVEQDEISRKLKGFRMPKFNLYDGEGDPVAHLRGYCSEMRNVGGKDELLMAYFSESLTGAALKWHTRQDVGKRHTWDDMAQDFVRHFQYNIDIVPDRSLLSQTEKKPKESFKDFWLRWNEQVAQDGSPIDKKDVVKPRRQQGLVVVLSKRLQAQPQPQTYPRAPHNPPQHYLPNNDRSDVQTLGHSLSQRLGPVVVLAKCFQPQYQPCEHPQTPHKTPQYYPPNNIRSSVQPPGCSLGRAPAFQNLCVPSQHFQASNNPRKLRHEGKLRQKDNFTPIGESYTSLFGKLKHSGLIEPLLGYTPDPYANGFDPANRCMYHSNVQGHSIEDFRSLKRKIERMIQEWVVVVNDSDREHANPLGNLLIKVDNVEVGNGLGNIDGKLSG